MTEARKFPRWAKVLIAVIVAALLAYMAAALFGEKTNIEGGGSAHAATIPEPADDPPMKAIGFSLANDGWSGATGYWQQNSIPKKECQWVKNPNYVPGGKKPRYIQYCVTHWLAAWVPLNPPQVDAIDYGTSSNGYGPTGANAQSVPVPAAAQSIFGAARVICLDGHVKVRSTNHYPLVGDTGTNYWGKLTQTVCVNNAGTITFKGQIHADGDTGTVGDFFGWAYLGHSDPKGTSFAANHYRSSATFKFRQCIGAERGCLRIRTKVHTLKLDWFGIFQELFYYAGVDGQWVAP